MASTRSTRCCLCKGSGRCVSCHCVKSGVKCGNCGPFRANRCQNQPPSGSSIPVEKDTSETSSQANRQTQPVCTEVASVTQTNSIRPPNVNFVWDEVDGTTFIRDIEKAYADVVHWRGNLFLIPSGSAGKDFVHEQARLFQACAEGTALETVAIMAAMTMPALLLQKPYNGSKAKEHSSCLRRRLDSWKAGNIEALLLEGKTIQQQLPPRNFAHGVLRI